KYLTIFKICLGLYKILVILFRLIKAPTIFQYYINNILKNYLDVFYTIYFNNILIYRIFRIYLLYFIKAI
ncbi:hypothetical protein BO82DRAFT_297052, partial [Aspergillus uvarum CBS 121591]